METIKNPSIQSLPQDLNAKLHQLRKEFALEKIFFHAATANDPGHLILISGSTKNVAVMESRKWLRNCFKEHHVLFHVLSSEQLRYAYKKGNPFIAAHCVESTKVYQNTDYKFSPSTTWKSFKKRYKKFERGYYYEHDILMNMANDFYRLEARTSVFLTYISLYEHHLTYLEQLYIGHSYNSKTVTERIKYLAPYLPFVEDLFVKQNGAIYYLIEQLEKARQAAEEADEIYINWDLCHAIKEVEGQLYGMVSDRFIVLKKRIKANISNDIIIAPPETPPADQQLSSVISQINKIKHPEEIYQFHRSQTASITKYYLLLIGEGIGTEMLNRMQHSVDDTFKDTCAVVLIAHSRLWIQRNLFFHQDFFKKIMTEGNRVFNLPGKRFTVHWEDPYTALYGDLDYMYKATDKVVSQYFVLRHYAAPDNAEGLKNMFSTAILRAFRTFIYAKSSYRSNYLSAHNLWMLCLYAQPNLVKIEYLFEKLGGDTFFGDVDNDTKFHHRQTSIPEEKGLLMDEILNVLIVEMKAAFELAIEAVVD